jgi:D-erythronate 2-dehydrogenase
MTANSTSQSKRVFSGSVLVKCCADYKVFRISTVNGRLRRFIGEKQDVTTRLTLFAVQATLAYPVSICRGSILNIIITGGAGFLGVLLARELLTRSSLRLHGTTAQRIERITLCDRAPPPQDLAADARAEVVIADINTALQPGDQNLITSRPGTNVVFHLAAAVSGECEADFDLGMRSNLAATQAMLESCRALSARPLVFFASSLAVFGNTSSLPLPEVVSDTTLPTPQSSYGIQKFMGEQLMADYGRKQFIRSRSARLMTVSVRPGKPNGAASGFLSGMIREPLAGVPCTVPVSPDTAVALSSPQRTIEGIIRCVETSDDDWGALTAINLPALSTSVGSMAEALQTVGGASAHALLSWQIDPQIERIVGSWPKSIAAPRANRLGLHADDNFDDVIRAFIMSEARNCGRAS